MRFAVQYWCSGENVWEQAMAAGGRVLEYLTAAPAIAAARVWYGKGYYVRVLDQYTGAVIFELR